VYTQPPDNTATLTTTVVKPLGYTGTLTYTWTPGGDILGSITSTNPYSTLNNVVNNTVWEAPSDFWLNNQTAEPQAQVCVTGTNGVDTCGSCQVGVGTPPIAVAPLYFISGNVYKDDNKNGVFNPPPPLPGESVYGDQSLPITICPNFANPPAKAITYCPSMNGNPLSVLQTTNGLYNTGATLPAGTYTVSLTGLPKKADNSTDQSYSYTSHTFQVTVGN
jgi:hypothetical protein